MAGKLNRAAEIDNLMGAPGFWDSPQKAQGLVDERRRLTAQVKPLQELVAGLRSLWTDDESEYHGRHVDFGPLLSYPKPVQRPHPPVMLGNWGPVGIRHVIEYADQWGPVDSFLADPVAQLTEFRQRCAGLGISGVTLHSYRYAWAERALQCGYPERFAQQALGHNSKAVHHAYSKHAEVTVPSLRASAVIATFSIRALISSLISEGLSCI